MATRRDATGILKVADEVEELYFPNLAASGEGIQGSLKGGEVQAIRFHGNAAALHAMALQNTQVNKVGGVLEENDIPGVAKAFRDEIKKLLRAMSDQNALVLIDLLIGGII